MQRSRSAGTDTLSLCSSAWQMMSSQMDADGAKQCSLQNSSTQEMCCSRLSMSSWLHSTRDTLWVKTSKKNPKIHDKKKEEEITNQKDQIHLKCADDMVIRLNFIQRFDWIICRLQIVSTVLYFVMSSSYIRFSFIFSLNSYCTEDICQRQIRTSIYI